MDAGGLQSILYLREAITMAQMMGLDREYSYRDLSADEQQFRKRVLWLLFITERSGQLLQTWNLKADFVGLLHCYISCQWS